MTDTNNNYKNKYFSILGDSISTLEGYSEPKYAVYYDTARKISSGVLTLSDTWWGQVVEGLGGELLVNNSWSGSTVCSNPLYEVPSYGCSDKRTAALGKDGILPDVIMLFMGTNDWGLGIRVSNDRFVKGNENNTEIFSVAYRKTLEKLKKNYPEAEIWCMTLPISRCSLKENFQFPYYYGGRHISEYCEAIRACAAQYDCRVVDLYRHIEPYDTVDGFHPNASGMKTLANAVIEELQNK